MKKTEFLWVLKWFAIWRLFLQLVIIFSTNLIQLQSNYLGGGLENYLSNPHLWVWGNYDGEHYMSISRFGYRPLEYFFFPFYPFLTHLLITFFGFISKTVFSYQSVGLLISHISFFTAICGLFCVFKKTFETDVVKLSILVLLFFPTSYYFASFYTEALFLCLVVWSLYFFSEKKYFWSGILGALASATRSTGVILLLAFLMEILLVNRKFELKQLWLLLIPSGLIIYMLYLNSLTGNPFAFNENGYIFGEYRSSRPILLPQVFYRYIFKIVPNLPTNYFPVFYTTLFELSSALVLCVFLAISVGKLKISWWIYTLGGFIAPTLYLNFVSLPRYFIVLFPLYILIAKFLYNSHRKQVVYFAISIILLVVSLSMFSRGYWVS